MIYLIFTIIEKLMKIPSVQIILAWCNWCN